MFTVNNKDTIDIILVSSFFILNTFHTLFFYFIVTFIKGSP